MERNDRDTPSPNHKPPSYQRGEELDVMALLEAAENGGSSASPVEQEELMASPCGSDSSKEEDDESEYQGEVDEGFDEEFEEPLAKEEGDAAPSFDMLNELNEKELQHLLADDVTMSASPSLPLPNPLLYDDFDYGVDVLDTESSAHNLLPSDPVKSPTPFSCVPSSPYQLVGGASSPMATTVLAGPTLDSLSQMNSYNAFMSSTHSESNSIGIPATITGDFADYHSATSSQGSSSHQSDDFNALYSVVGDVSQGSSVAFSMASATSCYEPHAMLAAASGGASNNLYNPTLTSVATTEYPLGLDSNSLMDLSAASRLVQGDGIFNTASTCSNVVSNGASSLASSTNCSKGSQTISYSTAVQLSDTTHLLSQANTDPQLSSPPDSPPVRSKPHPSSSSLPPSSPTSSSYGSPSPFSTNGSYSFSPSSNTANEPFSADFSDTESEMESISSLPHTNGELISMPFYKFKKILDSNSLSVKDKDLVKAVRRRGKNKVAAKNCRQKKLGVINTLQVEIDQLKALKKRLTLRTRTLEREISTCKQQFSTSHHAPSSQQR